MLLSPPPGSTTSSESLDDRLARVESDRQSLLLQVSVLTSQVDAQSETINDLERGLHRGQHRLIRAEDMLNSVSIII